MTDKQFDKVLKMILEIIRTSKDLQEAEDKIKALLDKQQGNTKHLMEGSLPALLTQKIISQIDI